MNVHEYQAKEILAKYGVPVQKGKVASSVEEATQIAQELKVKSYVLKAQIHAGGRGKGGGIKMAKNVDEVRVLASQLLGMRLVTPQTGASGKIVRKILVAESINIKKEYYLGMVVDRSEAKIVLMGSQEGGMDIEEVAKHHPEKLLKLHIDPTLGISPFQARQLVYDLEIDKSLTNKAIGAITGLYKAFVESDCSLAEINPLAVSREGDLIAIDAKLNFDDNALYRHPDISAMRDPNEEDPRELDAKSHGLSYVSLDGNIGCMVNGAGLAMATMDLIKLHGGQPANFLDVGGGASTEQVVHAFKLILADERVKAILVNIFGGIMKCDVIANGVIEAAKQIQLKVPLVVRLEGTNVDLGRKLISESGLNIIAASSLEEAAKKVVEAAAN